jgi:hypothetical protein
LRDVANAGMALRAVLSDDSDLRAFALVDGALLANLPVRQRKTWAPAHGVSLFERADHAAFAVGPLLFELTLAQIESGVPNTLLDLVGGLSAGSFIVTRADIATLSQRLQKLVDVTLDDGTDMVMRFFDPRVLPFWLAVVDPVYERYVAGVVEQWLYWGADFSLKTYCFEPATGDGVLPELPMKISVKQEQTLLDACAPWTMVERFRANGATALEGVPVGQRYAFFEHQLQRAQSHGLQGQPTLEGYCGIALECGPVFDEDKAMQDALALVKEGQSFDDAVATLNDQDWKRMRGAV